MPQSKKPLTRQERYKRSHPWVRFVEWARRRCGDSTDERWKIYREKGIKCLLSASYLKEVWERDKAHLLKKPSLDRFPDTNGNYEPGNVRFIEFSLNSKIAADGMWARRRDEPTDDQLEATERYIESLGSQPEAA